MEALREDDWNLRGQARQGLAWLAILSSRRIRPNSRASDRQPRSLRYLYRRRCKQKPREFRPIDESHLHAHLVLATLLFCTEFAVHTKALACYAMLCYALRCRITKAMEKCWMSSAFALPRCLPIDASKWQTKRGASQVSEDLKIESVDVYYNPNVSCQARKGFPVWHWLVRWFERIVSAKKHEA